MKLKDRLVENILNQNRYAGEHQVSEITIGGTQGIALAGHNYMGHLQTDHILFVSLASGREYIVFGLDKVRNEMHKITICTARKVSEVQYTEIVNRMRTREYYDSLGVKKDGKWIC